MKKRAYFGVEIFHGKSLILENLFYNARKNLIYNNVYIFYFVNIVVNEKLHNLDKPQHNHSITTTKIAYNSSEF